MFSNAITERERERAWTQTEPFLTTKSSPRRGEYKLLWLRILKGIETKQSFKSQGVIYHDYRNTSVSTIIVLVGLPCISTVGHDKLQPCNATRHETNDYGSKIPMTQLSNTLHGSVLCSRSLLQIWHVEIIYRMRNHIQIPKRNSR